MFYLRLNDVTAFVVMTTKKFVQTSGILSEFLIYGVLNQNREYIDKTLQLARISYITYIGNSRLLESTIDM